MEDELVPVSLQSESSTQVANCAYNNPWDNGETSLNRVWFRLSFDSALSRLRQS